MSPSNGDSGLQGDPETESRREGKNSRRLLLVGWDAADWNVINPLLDEGKMPTLAGLINRGVSGSLETLYPPLSPMLWTSIATGKRPYKHGIYGFSEPDPNGAGVRPVTNLSRKTKALWNILQHQDQQSVVVGWWPSHPAEPIDGVMVSDHYHKVTTSKVDAPWPLESTAVHPARLLKKLAKLRMHPAELLPEHILPFVPNAATIDQKSDPRLSSLSKTLAECISVNAAATALIQNESWDFMAVYFDSIDHFCHLFMKYHPPQQEWVNERDFELYQGVIAGAYQFHDMMLGALLSLVDDQTTVMLISDHGFHPDHLRPREIPAEPAGPATEHSPYGVFVMAGPDVERDKVVHGASLLDITPTILHAFDLPIGEDMDGRVLTEVFSNKKDIESIPSWDEVPGDCGMHSIDYALDPEESQAAMQQLVALGYIEEPDAKVEKTVENTKRELQYNLARSYMDGNRHVDAIPILKICQDRWPEESRFGVQLIQCYLAIEQITNARECLMQLIESKQDSAKAAQTEIESLLEQLKAEGKQLDDLSKQEQSKLRRLRAQALVNPYAANMLEGSLFFAEEEFEKALASFENAEPFRAERSEVYIRMAQSLRKLERYEDAVKRICQALEIDSRHPEALLECCRCQLKLNQIDQAEESARQSLGYRFQNPWGHFLLAAALIRRRRFHEAVSSLEQAIAQNPNFPKAHAALAELYEGPLFPNHIKAAAQRHLEAAAKSRIEIVRGSLQEPLPDREPARQAMFDESTIVISNEIRINKKTSDKPPEEVVTIVSGLPRSGTSMMMNMLDAAGLGILTDRVREADQDNPQGYFEFLPATQLRSNRDWLPQARGKGVKIVAQLLRYLPKNESYRFIMMERSLEEVLLSQEKMLLRNNDKGLNRPISQDVTSLKRAFTQQMSMVNKFLDRSEFPIMRVPFSVCIHNPLEASEQLRNFLGIDFNTSHVAERVDKRLYRNRT